MAYKREDLNIEQLERLMKGAGKKFVSLEEGAALMSLGRNNFREIAKDAKAVYKIKRRVLINMEKITSSWKLSWMMKSKGGRDHGKNFIRM